MPHVVSDEDIEAGIARHNARQAMTQTQGDIAARLLRSQAANVARLPERPQNPPTQKMRNFIYVLLSKLRNVKPDEYAIAEPWVRANEQTMTFELARKTIVSLKDHLGLNEGQTPLVADPQPDRVPYVKDTFEDVPDGNYAIDPDREGGNTTVFYRVSTNKSNARRRVQRRLGPNLDWVRWPQAVKVLERIRQATPKVAALRYADELGHCYHCNLELTDDVSRARRIGPICFRNGHAFE